MSLRSLETTGESNPVLELKNLYKTFQTKTNTVEALKNVSISVNAGDIFGIIGLSGAGKSTLVRCVNMLERPDSGGVYVSGNNIATLREKELLRIRQKIGMIFQQFNLLKSRTVYENVAFPLRYLKKNRKEIDRKVGDMLAIVGLTDKARDYPSQLSGGQKQRVAIARALVTDPKILLSDEATSALDPQTTDSILNLLKELNMRFGLTIVLITHEMDVIKKICNKVAVLESGEVAEQGALWDVFANPSSDIAKKMLSGLFKLDNIQYILDNVDIGHLFRGNLDGRGASKPEWGWIVHLLFKGEKANNAYIAYLVKEFGIDVSILYGNIEIIQLSPLGSLFVAMTGDRRQAGKALDFLRSEGVAVHILKEYEYRDKQEEEDLC
ncbi:MAG: ATP-binding cassette domain-containing protein [Synergistaceae bacterium]|jgi:D-methionine transport system ATP-binding protein|nr:ATP-binding cassette domain-containing protein [Synergistaceae bacterium]